MSRKFDSIEGLDAPQTRQRRRHREQALPPTAHSLSRPLHQDADSSSGPENTIDDNLRFISCFEFAAVEACAVFPNRPETPPPPHLHARHLH